MAGAMIGAAPDRAVDPHGEPLADPGGTAVPEHLTPELATGGVEVRPSPAAAPHGPSRGSEPAPVQAPTFRARAEALARLAVTTASQRRTLLAALFAVAVLSVSVGVLAGRWLAARATAGAEAPR
jgi:hypothetical protein